MTMAEQVTQLHPDTETAPELHDADPDVVLGKVLGAVLALQSQARITSARIDGLTNAVQAMRVDMGTVLAAVTPTAAPAPDPGEALPLPPLAPRPSVGTKMRPYAQGAAVAVAVIDVIYRYIVPLILGSG